mmetsp:Transcript_25776/g.72813  ORF Transcript_25776/g.72813 Transcript_25776/m.72813 type:complete len:202 (-) Transcript_25776:446-1051(-)
MFARVIVANTPTPGSSWCAAMARTASATRLECHRSSSSPNMAQTERFCSSPGPELQPARRAASASSSAAWRCWNCVRLSCCCTTTTLSGPSVVARSRLLPKSCREASALSVSAASAGVDAYQLNATTSSAPSGGASCRAIDLITCPSRSRRAFSTMWTATSTTITICLSDSCSPNSSFTAGTSSAIVARISRSDSMRTACS